MNEDHKPDTGDLVNDSIVDSVVDIMDDLEDCYDRLCKTPGWYNLIKQNDKHAARMLIKFFFLVREEWLEYGRSKYKAGVFGLVKEDPKLTYNGKAINLDKLPY